MAKSRIRSEIGGFYRDNKTVIFIVFGLFIYWVFIRPFTSIFGKLTGGITEKINASQAESKAKKEEAKVKADNPSLKASTASNIERYKADAKAIAVAFNTQGENTAWKLTENEAAAAQVLYNYKRKNTKGQIKTVFTIDQLAPYYKEVTKTSGIFVSQFPSGRSLKADIVQYMNESKWKDLVKAVL